MKRREKISFAEEVTIENLHEAWLVVRKTCKNKPALFLFSLRLNAHLYNIQQSLLKGTYRPEPYHCFIITEPKARLVMSQSIRDKIVNHFVAQHFLLPMLEASLIDANVATRIGRGTAYAEKLLRRYFDQLLAERPGAPIYALKVDVSKYFYRIDHKLLMEKLRKRIKDKRILALIETIISETNRPYINATIDRQNRLRGHSVPRYEYGRGLSIGAMTSQFLAVFFLNDLDHLLKEQYHCRHYIRYMDDFLILDHDKARLSKLMDAITKELHALKLDVNPKSRIYNCSGGFIFLGRRYSVCHRKLRVDCSARTVRRVRKKLRRLAKDDPDKYLRSRASYRGYLGPRLDRMPIPPPSPPSDEEAA